MTETADMQAASEPIAWRAIVYGTPVFAAGGERVGTVREVLGSDSEDVFHGLRLETGAGEADRILLADDVTLITTNRIETRLSADRVKTLERYDEPETYHLASVGWLRRHLGWRKDSESDEEPG
jgi:hypothetical protein